MAYPQAVDDYLLAVRMNRFLRGLGVTVARHGPVCPKRIKAPIRNRTKGSRLASCDPAPLASRGLRGAGPQRGLKRSLAYFTPFHVIPPLLNLTKPVAMAAVTSNPEMGARRKYWSREALSEKYACVV
jgi:hypothetical protein